MTPSVLLQQWDQTTFAQNGNFKGALQEHLKLMGKQDEPSTLTPSTLSTCGRHPVTRVKSAMDEQVWSTIPLSSHEIIDDRDGVPRDFFLQQAFDRLDRVHGTRWATLKPFLKNVAWTRLKADYANRESQITSSSFPALPFFAFVSDKAMRHIPPNSVSAQPSYLYLAENLFHEAIHQQVNLTLLEKDVFIDAFNAQTAPKIDIAWRSDQCPRNQRWELDRTLHAAAVYVELVSFRQRELRQGDLSDDERRQFQDAWQQGQPALDFLTEQLMYHRSWFTDLGQELITQLRQQAFVRIYRRSQGA